MRNFRLPVSGIIALVVLFVLLGFAGRYAIYVWTTLGDVHMSTAGWVFLVAGVVVSLLVGVGLMALTFYSNRHDYDR